MLHCNFLMLCLIKLFFFLSLFSTEKVVEPLHSRNKFYYYHRQFQRVPTIDECEVDEPLCIFEANEQFRRDRSVFLMTLFIHLFFYIFM